MVGPDEAWPLMVGPDEAWEGGRGGDEPSVTQRFELDAASTLEGCEWLCSPSYVATKMD